MSDSDDSDSDSDSPPRKGKGKGKGKKKATKAVRRAALFDVKWLRVVIGKLTYKIHKLTPQMRHRTLRTTRLPRPSPQSN